MRAARVVALGLAVAAGLVVVLGLLPPPSPHTAAVPRGAGAVVGPAVAPWDRTYPASRTNTGLAFDFRVPRTPMMWCNITEPESVSDMEWPGEISWSCGEGNAYGDVSGIVTVSPCQERLCDLGLWRRTLESGELIDDTARAQGVEAVERPDPTTAYYEYTDPDEKDGRPRYRLLMFALWDRGDETGAPDADVTAIFSGPPERRDEVRKIVNDIHEGVR